MTVRHIKMRRGTTFTLANVVARKADGTKIDLTGLTGTGVAWRIGLDDRKTTKVTKSIGSGVTVAAGTGGKFTVQLDPADTTGLEPGWYSHEAEVTESGGDVTTVLRGRLELQRDLPA